MERILIADDEENIAELISDSLMEEGYETVVVHNGIQVLDEIYKDSNFHLILLDIMMPQLDGLGVMKKIRDEVRCPILFVSAKSRSIDTILGLELGADDYITKPFVVEELVAKVKAHIRRDKRVKEQDGPQEEQFGDFRINRESYELYKNNCKIELSTREFQLFLFMLDHAGKVLTREQIFDGVWGMDYVDMTTVTVTIKNLRNKIDNDNEYIKTIWGVGYKLAKK